jgi:cysteine synthase
MDPLRRDTYSDLRAAVSHSPLTQVLLDLPRGNRIWMKDESANVSGSHYGRVYVDLLEELEASRKIIPGETPLIEVSSGSAGEAFAWACDRLGYQFTLVVPECAPKTKLARMQKEGGTIVQTPTRDYVAGSIQKLREILESESGLEPTQRHYCPNHSRERITLKALGNLASEAIMGFHGTFDYFVACIGNGSSLLGPGRILKEANPDLEIIAWEPFVSGFGFEMKYPGEYQRRFGIQRGNLPHNMPGAGVSNLEFPFVDEAIGGNGKTPIVDSVRLVREAETEKYVKENINPGGTVSYGKAMGGYSGEQMRRMQSVLNLRSLPKWEDVWENLRDGDFNCGKTTCASIEVARRKILESGPHFKFKLKKQFPWVRGELMDPTLRDKNFLVIGYDSMDNY